MIHLGRLQSHLLTSSALSSFQVFFMWVIACLLTPPVKLFLFLATFKGVFIIGSHVGLSLCVCLLEEGLIMVKVSLLDIVSELHARFMVFAPRLFQTFDKITAVKMRNCKARVWMRLPAQRAHILRRRSYDILRWAAKIGHAA